MKKLNPFIHAPRNEAERLAAVRGIAEGTAPTGRVLLCRPWREFRAPAAPKWIATSNNLQALRDLNLIAAQ